MLLTKDNLLRFVREKKYTTPALVAEAFETNTMIASAALSELSKEKLVAITHLKLSSSPYYYDPRQPQSLQDLAEKHFSQYDKEVYNKLKSEQVVNDASLSIQLRLAVERIKDFAIPLEIDFQGRGLKFWIWYLRDLKETRQQIVDVLSGKNSEEKKVEKKESTPKKSEHKKETQKTLPEEKKKEEKPMVKLKAQEEDEIDQVIEKFLSEHHLRIEGKSKEDKDILYELSLRIHEIKIRVEAKYYGKKASEAEILKYYGSNSKPKVVFVKNPAKKILKLADNLDNLTLVDLS